MMPELVLISQTLLNERPLDGALMQYCCWPLPGCDRPQSPGAAHLPAPTGAHGAVARCHLTPTIGIRELRYSQTLVNHADLRKPFAGLDLTPFPSTFQPPPQGVLRL